MRRFLPKYAVIFCFLSVGPATLFGQTNAWINEIHYDNTGTDQGEAVEIVIENPGKLTDYQIDLYNGSNGEYYASQTLDNLSEGTTVGNYTFFTWHPKTFQNGPDGLALSYHGTLLQFLSYEGSFIAKNGPAEGEVSKNIGVSEYNDPIGKSLQLSGKGLKYGDFHWEGPEANTFGQFNDRQTFGQPENTGPVINGININPQRPTSSDAVAVSAEITDPDGISSVVLHWGSSLDNLENEISMNLGSGDTYRTLSSIPAQPDQQRIYYSIAATDDHVASKTTTSGIQQYTVDDPVQTDFIAIQNFDHYIPAWHFSSDVDFFDNNFGDDGYFGLLNVENMAPLSQENFNGNILAENDLSDEGDYGTGDFAKITFEPIDISAYQNVQLSFDYQILGYNAHTDEVNYQLFYDDSGQGKTILHRGGGSSENAKGTFSVNIPDNIDRVSLVLSLKDNGADGYSGFDNFILKEADHNLPPTITAITQTPAKEHVSQTKSVSVGAEIVDGDGIGAVSLQWGTTAGDLSHTIPMELKAENRFVTTETIPAQGEGTIVYYRVAASDTHETDPATANSPERMYTVTAPEPPGPILISEIMQNPVAVSDDEGEYFEVYNRTSEDIDMNGWKIVNAHTSETISSSVLVPSHGYAVFGINADPETNGGVAVDYQYNSFFFLGNSADQIILTDATNHEIDRVEYDGGSVGSVWPNPSGASMYFSGSPEGDNNDGSSWKLATSKLAISEDLGSPGFSGESSLPETYVYNHGWLPAAPTGHATAKDIISLETGSVDLSAATEVFNLSIAAGGTLKISGVFSFKNYINNQGKLIFKSRKTGTGQLGEVPAEAKIIGSATVQRFIPARRAFRFVASGVSTSTSIHANWQEAAATASENPRPGFGTHISGSVQGKNGFDATPSGNPSLFVFQNDTEDQSKGWQAVKNTNETVISAGKAYRLFVRGDRSIDVTSNAAPPTKTIVEATGKLAIGEQTQQNFNRHGGNFNFFGNPYQAIVDMNKVLAHSRNLNTTQYYVWDPNRNTRGAYVTVELPSGLNASGSAANQFLQPGQAAFVRTKADGAASMTFRESDKAVNENETKVFAIKNLHTIKIQLLSDGSVNDGLLLEFAPGATNAIRSNDAPKLGNLDENLAMVDHGKYFSIVHRAMPTKKEVLPLWMNQYRKKTYQLKVEVENLSGFTPFLKDAYLNTQTVLPNNTTTFLNFSVDEAAPKSLASDRFSIAFMPDTLEASIENFKKFSLYPNPVKEGVFFAHVPSSFNERRLAVRIYDLFGREVFQQVKKVENSKFKVTDLNLSAGVYVVKLNVRNVCFSKKIVVK